MNQVCSPPELPPYLKSVYDLKPIVGSPKDDEVVGIHAVIRMAQKAVDIPGTGNAALLAQLSEHLFDVQMGTVLPETTTYAPPALPVHVTVQLEPITGIPSAEYIKTWSYRSIYLISDGYTQRASERHAHSASCEIPSSSVTGTRQRVAPELSTSTNNVGSGASTIEPQLTRDIGIQDALERSNRLAEQTNQLIERSNQVAERANQIVEESNHPVGQSNELVERFNQLFERLN
ncbi:hypothetical protein FRC11_005755 [Ceratobasidium sp. 423]|nr:hypothetical protein FRC11_005755 [Ceratobasidium sp. 423]